MAKASYPLKLPASLKSAAEKLAKEDGVSLNQWISMTIAHRIGAQETAKEFFRRRAGNAKPEDLLKFLDKAPKGVIVPGDELPENYRASKAAKPAAE